ncbi:ribosome hibernation-promoting factor, HPF/YfiA family [Jannaschia sp. LMIT008]|uniref:ribosome hibernation-promoting factor, HPF/YfiA family n=1 Tax=Jannaschia maritima TaxID=3032585 RepID=UPI002811DE5D|nr:ribosome-associated translation inhibitor RaiA [Jannaschia sp. LMIT008]
MRYQVTGLHIDVGDSLKAHAEAELGAVIEKYAQRPIEAQVVFSRAGHEYVCEATIHLSTGLKAQARGRADEIYAAFDSSAEKLEKQLRRYKRRLKNHHQTRADPVEVLDASSYVIAFDEGEEEPETLQPVIVAEMQTQISTLSVGEAVMRMELASAPVLVFKNEKGGGLNVVYRRDDGNVGWIDPVTARG